MDEDTKKLKKLLRKKTKKKKESNFSSDQLLSTGLTRLDILCTNSAKGGFLKGKYYFLVGDSASGKTFLGLTCLAEASINKNFENFRLIYDNVEDGALMNVEAFFGKKLAKRIESPAKDEEGLDKFSETVEDFYYNVDDAINQEQPFIYILDSEASLSSEYEGEKFETQKKAHRDNKDAAGSYGDNKAKVHSSNLRRLIPILRKSGSILIIVTQTRDNLGYGFEKKIRPGGRALKFYASLEIWSSTLKKLKKTVKGKSRTVGILSKLEVKKNRITGQTGETEAPIYHSFGFDNVGSCVDYLVQEGHWKKSKQTIKATEFDFKGTQYALIRKIEKEDREDELKKIVGQVWADIQEACQVHRKKRY